MAAAEDADRRWAALLTVCGKTTYALMKDLVTPEKPKDKTFDELIDIVANVPVSRYKFSTHGRKEGQSVSEFVADLRRLAEHCEFGATLDEMLRCFRYWHQLGNDPPEIVGCSRSRSD